MTSLRSDRDLTFPHIYQLEASAGSGKTYALTHRTLQFLLSSRITHAGLDSLLAVTFTNKAANEMKRRILSNLIEVIFGEWTRIDEIKALVDLNEKELRSRAKGIVREIFDDPTRFSVKTIDSFLVGLGRAAAWELKIPPSLEVEVDVKRRYEEAVESLIDEVGRNDEVTGWVEKSVQEVMTLEGDSGWDFSSIITRHLLNVRAWERAVGKAIVIPPESEWGRREELLDEITGCAEKILEWIKRDELGFNTRSRIQEKLDEVVDTRRIEPLMDSTLFSRPLSNAVLKRYRSGLKPEMEDTWRKMRKTMGEVIELLSRLSLRPFLLLKNHVDGRLEHLLAAEGRTALEELTFRLMLALGGSGGVPEIYLILAERINHYLIDEFQDTNPSQWECLRPLVEESLAGEGSLFYVGDKKQAIYRFRGGDVTLFDEAPKSFPSAAVERDRLPKNWRSGRILVEFFNQTFSEKNLSAWYENELDNKISRELFDEKILPVYAGVHQDPDRDGGYLRIEGVEFEKGVNTEEAQGILLDKVMEEILPDILQRYSHREVAFLTRKRDEAALVSRYLMARDIPVASPTTLHVGSSPAVRQIMALLAFLHSPTDDLSLLTFLSGTIFSSASGFSPNDLQDVQEWMAQEERAPLIVRFREKYEGIWTTWFTPLFGRANYLTPYDLIQFILHHFNVLGTVPDESGFLHHLLEVVYTKEGEGEALLGDLLAFWQGEEEDDLFQVPLAEEADAIRVTTIHKAKGLEFPVVIVPFALLSRPNIRLVYRVDGRGITPHLIRKGSDASPLLKKLKEEEMAAGLLDDLNAFYVSVTRAEDELYLFVPFYNRMQQKAYPPLLVSPGELREEGSKCRSSGTPVTRWCHPSVKRREGGWEKRLKRRRREKPHLETGEGRAARERGDRLHALFASWNSVEKLQEGLEAVRGDPLEPYVTPLAANEDIQKLFDPPPGASIRNEVPLVDASGRLHYADRIIEEADAVTIVEWKTGEMESEDHVEQVRGYIGIVAAARPGKRVSGVIVYTEKGKMIRVVAS